MTEAANFRADNPPSRDVGSVSHASCEPTVLFGIGAAKAGTSWLHAYLNRHPDCSFRGLKELHYFNVLHSQMKNWPRNSRQRRALSLERKLLTNPEHPNEPRLRRLQQTIAEWDAVFDGISANDTGYLDFLSNGAQPASLIGEITPAYATLDENAFRHMATISTRTKFVLLLRDPLDRLWSNVRMSASNNNIRFGGDLRGSTVKMIDSFLQGTNQNLALRSDYKRTIECLFKAVPSKDILIEFFEGLFTPEAIRRITSFLGISYVKADFDVIRHEGKKMDLSTDLRRRVLTALAPQYEFINAKFGDRVPARWHTHYQQVEMAGR